MAEQHNSENDSEDAEGDDLATFCRMVRQRSAENAQAMRLLFNNRLLANCMSILRQEVDSLVRTIYLLATNDPSRREELLRDAAKGMMWQRENGHGRVTDREMVDLATRLRGWTASVYKFGCGFIHLSRYHDYNTTDPLSLITDEERLSILDHMRYYHGGPESEHPTFEELASYIPRVFEKIRSNLECYIEQLESGRTFEGD